MKFTSAAESAPQDSWVWGTETILWGFSPQHEYTLKLLEPRPGRDGCLSLQHHHEKSETWFVLEGKVWALVVQNDYVITRVMKKGDFQNLPAGTIHRLMGITPDAKVLESSTPDRHAADKSVKKDVVRLHCVHGRECESYSKPEKQDLVDEAIEASERAILAVEAGEVPEELNVDYLIDAGAVPMQPW